MTIPVEMISDEVKRRYGERKKSDITSKACYTLTGSIQGKIMVAADWGGVSRSALVQLLLEDAMKDIEEQFAVQGYPEEGDE
jgi:hypothetical protein